MVNITLYQLAYELTDLYKSVYKDTDLDLRHFMDWIHMTRAMLCKQKFDKPLMWIDESFIQDLGANVQLERVDSSIVTTLPTERYYLRTVLDIPPTIERSNHMGTFTRIGSPDRLESSFNIVTPERWVVSGNGKFNSRDIFVTVMEQKIYLTSKDPYFLTMKYLDVRGVFQNPIEAGKIKLSTYSASDNYPISASMINDLKNIIVQDKFKLILQPQQDKVADEDNNLTKS
jgi:hypothetical protein